MTKWIVGGVAAVFLMGIFMAASFTALNQPKNASAASCGGAVSAPNLDAEAKQNAGIIIGVVQKRGLPMRAAVIAIATAMQESGLHNVGHGDAAGPDSRGLFQQRDSWGPLAVRMDPAGATGLFLDALVQVADWQTRSLGDVAHAVQKFQDGLQYKYAANEPTATAIVRSFQPAAACAIPASGPGQPGNPLAPCKPGISQGYGPVSWIVEPPAHGFPHFHGGIDLTCPTGTPIHNIEFAGKAHVTMSGAGYGNHVDVEVQAPSGHYYVRYAHLATVAVQDGQPVNVGDPIGTEGSTGASTGPHLHFGVYLNGQTENDTVDPSSWLAL